MTARAGSDERPLDDELQKQIFRDLVARQDGGEDAKTSRNRIAEELGLEVSIVRDIEGRGLAAGWPPLDPPELSAPPEG